LFRQIIVFTKSATLPSIQGLKDAAHKLGLPLKVFNPFQELTWDTAKGELSTELVPYISWNSIGNQELILLRTSGVLFDDMDLYLGEELKERGAHLHCPISSLQMLRNKNQQALWLSRQGLAHVKTLLKRGPLTTEELELWCVSKEYVVKSVRGNKGIGLKKFNKEELLDFWEQLQAGQDQRYLIQPFHGETREIRHLVIGEDSFFIEKFPGSDWRRNAEFSVFKEVALENTEKEILLVNAKHIQHELKATCFAIDYLYVENNWEILEINANPGLHEANKHFEVNLYEIYLNSFLVT
jgi:glutathione synthase/RimK-type ligase-like ATP-grasp enzyme